MIDSFADLAPELHRLLDHQEGMAMSFLTSSAAMFLAASAVTTGLVPANVAAHPAQAGMATQDAAVRSIRINTCIESTGRVARELSYHATFVADATAAFSPGMMHAAHTFNGSTYAYAIRTGAKLIASLEVAATPAVRNPS
ncbi:hypothetical protein [Microvirga sp. M2]|uniref:hypothetical protein n=1 Tax=Microvirga sp. M2 TaxID=3073270 RepID=UPI0039C2868A